MLTIRETSDKPCFICGGKEKTAEVSLSDKTFRGVLCLMHIYEKANSGKEVTGAAREAGGRTAQPVGK
jgi:hypothetical protein